MPINGDGELIKMRKGIGMLDIGLLPQLIRRYAEGSDVSALKLKRR